MVPGLGRSCSCPDVGPQVFFFLGLGMLWLFPSHRPRAVWCNEAPKTGGPLKRQDRMAMLEWEGHGPEIGLRFRDLGRGKSECWGMDSVLDVKSLGHYPGTSPLGAFGICPLNLMAERKHYG